MTGTISIHHFSFVSFNHSLSAGFIHKTVRILMEVIIIDVGYIFTL